MAHYERPQTTGLCILRGARDAPKLRSFGSFYESAKLPEGLLHILVCHSRGVSPKEQRDSRWLGETFSLVCAIGFAKSEGKTSVIGIPTVIRGSVLEDAPYTRCDHLQQMAVRVAEVKRLASIFPGLPKLNRYSLLQQPGLPSG